MAEIPTHGTYDELVKKWEYAEEVYTGAFADEGKIKKYLRQRQQGEHDLNYMERKSEALADPALDYGLVIDSLNGIQFTAEPKSTRSWAETNEEGQPVRTTSFGDPMDDGGEGERASWAYRLKRDLDGEGTALITTLKKVGVQLKTKQWVWGVVDPAIENGDGEIIRRPVGRFVRPESILNWRSENGRLVEVVATTTIDMRDTVAQPYEKAQKEAFIVYDLDGWTIVDEDFEELEGVGIRTSAEYEFYATQSQETRILPIFRQRLPLPRRVGYLMARKGVALFNKESELDNYGRLICIPRLSLAAEHAQENVEDLAKGSVLTHPKESENVYLTPPAQAFSALDERLERKRQAFMVQSFREYGNTAREETATEKKQDWAGGVAAYLTLEASALQDFEQQLMWRMEQAIFADTPSAWGQYEIDRSTDFDPQDIKEQLSQLAKRMFGSRLPAPVDTKAKVLSSLYDEFGVEADEEELRGAVEDQEGRRSQRASAGGFNIGG